MDVDENSSDTETDDSVVFGDEEISDEGRLFGLVCFVIFFVIALGSLITVQPAFGGQNPYRAYLGIAIVSGLIGSYLSVKIWKWFN